MTLMYDVFMFYLGALFGGLSPPNPPRSDGTVTPPLSPLISEGLLLVTRH